MDDTSLKRFLCGSNYTFTSLFLL